MLSKLRTALLAAALAFPSSAALAEPITLEEAIAKANEAAPAMRANEAAIAAAQAGRTQASVRPNPTVTVENENFVGTGPYSIFGQAEVTAAYSQTIERGGKRDARIGVADREIGLAEASARVAQLDLAAQVERSFIDLLIAREVVRIAEYRLSTEQEIEREALRRVRGYKDPLFVETRAAARVAQARIDLQQAQARLVAAKNRLASFWGADGATIDVSGDFGWLTRERSKLAAADDALAAAEIDRSRAAVALEQARGTQDYTVSGGLRYVRGTGDVAVVAGITIPWGRFDRNQGGIERAQAERQRAEFLAEAQRLERLRRLASLNADADAARERAEAIMREVWPRAVRTLEQVREGYNRGGFTFRDVQDAADAILQVQDQWLEAVTQYRDLQTEIDRLTGRFDAAAVGESNP